MTTAEMRSYLIEQAALATARRKAFSDFFPMDCGQFDAGVLQGTEDAAHGILVTLFGDMARDEAVVAAGLLRKHITLADFEPYDYD